MYPKNRKSSPRTTLTKEQIREKKKRINKEWRNRNRERIAAMVREKYKTDQAFRDAARSRMLKYRRSEKGRETARRLARDRYARMSIKERSAERRRRTKKPPTEEQRARRNAYERERGKIPEVKARRRAAVAKCMDSPGRRERALRLA